MIITRRIIIICLALGVGAGRPDHGERLEHDPGRDDHLERHARVAPPALGAVRPQVERADRKGGNEIGRAHV